MKKLISYLLAWMFYYMGYTAYLFMFRFEVFYNLYRWLMVKSEQIQTWGGNTSPWK